MGSLCGTRLEQHFAANSFDDEKKQVAVLLSSIGASVYSLLRDLCFPKLPKDLKLGELTSLFEKQYGIRVSVWRERRKFYELRQSENQQISEYYGRLRNAAMKCSFGNSLNSILTDRFVSGLISGRILDRIYEESETATLDCLVELAMKVENAITAQVTSRLVHVIDSSSRRKLPYFPCHDVNRHNSQLLHQRRHSSFNRRNRSRSRERTPNHVSNNRHRYGNNVFKRQRQIRQRRQLQIQTSKIINLNVDICNP